MMGEWSDSAGESRQGSHAAGCQARVTLDTARSTLALHGQIPKSPAESYTSPRVWNGRSTGELQERFLRADAPAQGERTLLTLLLTFAIPRMDVRLLAARRIESFGTLVPINGVGS